MYKVGNVLDNYRDSCLVPAASYSLIVTVCCHGRDLGVHHSLPFGDAH